MDRFYDRCREGCIVVCHRLPNLGCITAAVQIDPLICKTMHSSGKNRFILSDCHVSCCRKGSSEKELLNELWGQGNAVLLRWEGTTGLAANDRMHGLASVCISLMRNTITANSGYASSYRAETDHPDSCHCCTMFHKECYHFSFDQHETLAESACLSRK